MARSSGYRRSKGGRPWRPFTPGTPPVASSHRVAVGSWAFKRRSGGRPSRATARGDCDRPASGVASRVAARRRSVQRRAQWGGDAQHAVQLSDGGSESGDEFYTPPRVLEDVGLEGSPSVGPGHADNRFSQITTRGMPKDADGVERHHVYP
ncbi:PREDICTED: uncharacterized protein LOC109146865 [Ipomoea nil]|uniref:uncharacterized protein LOC109146865 n=1 Tax=Ipomoea nil TaxID=35883 RepID=UPI000900D560|nr:PREDICTED: uncharacterized protein LOC109146865 [Ipomoea nil]